MWSGQGWANKAGDQYFKDQRQRADTADDKGRRIFFNMMRQIGDEIQTATSALNLLGPSPKVLDLCMAPGGYTASVLRYTPHAHVSGITLSHAEGGHKLLVRHGIQDSRVEVAELDITMLSSEFGAGEIPKDHPDRLKFLQSIRPYPDKSFDLIFCDGQVLRTHARSSYRECSEALRLTCSQLILAMQRIRPGGTLIMLLHKVDAWDTVNLLFQFDKFANVHLFKPVKKHAQRNSFYLIATDINPVHPMAISAVAGWKNDWREATFAYGQYTTEVGKRRLRDSEEESRVLAEFGSKLIKLGEPIWAIQRDALKGAAFIPREKRDTLQSPYADESQGVLKR
jgi:23S rRNA U2552 (ribose-2'-O)-methylase RlmE/FtsJ